MDIIMIEGIVIVLLLLIGVFSSSADYRTVLENAEPNKQGGVGEWPVETIPSEEEMEKQEADLQLWMSEVRKDQK